LAKESRLGAIYDISVALGGESITFPSDTPFSRETVVSIEESGLCNVSRIEGSAHSGTHVDAPYHFIAEGKLIAQLPVERFILPARVVEISNSHAVHIDELEKIEIQEGEALLFKTDNSLTGIASNGSFHEEYVYLSGEAADLLVEKRVGLVGLDYVSIDKYGDINAPAHRTLLRNCICVLEGINLSEVPAGEYTLICLPLKIADCEASPVRAVLVNRMVALALGCDREEV
jgi:arylformamidase